MIRHLVTIVTFALALAAPAAATSNHSYAPGEYAPIADGASPDGGFTVVAHGEGELGDDGFALHLARRPGETRVGRLTEEDDPFLDTDPAAYHAQWAPDSRHVAVRFRIDRHEVETLVWSVGGGRIERLRGPDLFAAALKHPDTAIADRRTAGLRTLVWTSADRFVVTETRVYRVKKTAPPKFGVFGRPLDDLGQGEVLQAFSVRADCELTGPATWRVRSLGPGDFVR